MMTNEVRLIDAPCGLFRHGDVLGFKTEYFLNGHVEAYVVESGELFYGGTETAQELNNLLVTPVDPDSLRPKGRWIKYENGVIVCSECGEEHEWEDYRASYCEDCGAKMEG